MAVYQLLGRGTYAHQIPYGQGVSPLWSFFQPPPAQNSILVYADGTVVERQTFDNDEIKDDQVFLYILGGTDFRCSDDSLAYTYLSDAGYTWRLVVDQDTYGAEYADAYNREWEQENTRIVEERQAAYAAANAEYYRQQRIAALQAELAALLSEE